MAKKKQNEESVSVLTPSLEISEEKQTVAPLILSTLPCSHENCGGSLQLVKSVDQSVHVEDYYMCGKCKRGQTLMVQRKLRQNPRR